MRYQAFPVEVPGGKVHYLGARHLIARTFECLVSDREELLECQIHYLEISPSKPHLSHPRIIPAIAVRNSDYSRTILLKSCRKVMAIGCDFDIKIVVRPKPIDKRARDIQLPRHVLDENQDINSFHAFLAFAAAVLVRPHAFLRAAYAS
jgi:hypothetical protein